MSENFRQVDLFGRGLPLCKFCGYPMLPSNAFRCEYNIAKHYEETGAPLDPFHSDWHIELREEERQQEQFGTAITESLNKYFKEHPRIQEQIEETRVESWVNEHTIKSGCKVSQVSIVGYFFGGAAP